MAVVTVYAPAHPLFDAGRQPNAREARAVSFNLFGKVNVTNGDSIGSKFYLGKIPSNARIRPQSVVVHDALTSASASLGLEKGATSAPNALINAQSFASAATKNAMLSVSNANLGKTVWELAGLSADPGGEFDLVLTLTAASAATGVVAADIEYATRA